ncbi:MAG: proline--tRNA ligase [Candidatus Aenigmarchaeota archaeon]|nr:proline--tRNA ligase [Candidatus Aenigmarchaeota archaeon]
MSEEMGITVKKTEFSEWYTQVVQKAGLVDTRYGIQGFLVHRPWAMRIIKRLYQLFEEELDCTGHEPTLFPLLIPEENLKKEEEHFQFAPEVFWVTEAGSDKLEKRYALRPTSETAIYPMYALWVRSYRDLPLKCYQSVSVYRYEPTTRPFLRGREFLWIEAHDVFVSHSKALEQIKQDMGICEKVIGDKLGLSFKFFKRPKWDKFKGAEDTYAADCMMPEGRVNQIASTHDLGQNFARAFGVNYKDESEREQVAWQTTFGMGIWRIMASLVAVFGDDKGLVLPPEVAPIQVVIVPIYRKGEGEEVIKKCVQLAESLKKFRVHIDKRDEKTPGFKFNEWELFGVTIRIEMGKREANEGKVTIARRDTGEKTVALEKDCETAVAKELSLIFHGLKEKSLKLSSTAEAKTMDEIMNAKTLFIKTQLCSSNMDGEECAKKLKEIGLHVRGTLLDRENPKGTCSICGKKANEVVYLARAY